MSETNQDKIIEKLKKEIEIQNKFIVIVKGFFSSNSEFIKLYRQSILDTKEKIFLKFSDLSKNVI